MGIFKVEDGLLVLSTEELRAIPAFRVIIERDKGDKTTPGGRSFGDHDGRKKYRAFKELLYVYYMADYQSPYAPLSDSERHTKTVKLCNFEEGEEYKPDKRIKEAIVAYQDLYYSKFPSFRLLNSLEKGLHISDQVITTLVKAIENKLKTVNARLENEPDALLDIDSLVTNLNTLNTMASSIPKALTNIEEVRAKVREEQGSGMVAKGGRSVGRREDPEYVKEKFAEEQKEFDNEEI